MAVPDFQIIMLPLVKMMSDGQEYSLTQMVNFLAIQFGLTEEDLTERIPSGRQARFYNRVAWATTHLKKAVVIVNTRRGIFRITPRGSKLLSENLARIDLPILVKFPEYAEFRNFNRTSKIKAVAADETSVIKRTPDELLDESYQAIRDSLASEVLDTVKSGTPEFFEKLVVDLLVKMGYGGNREEASASLTRRSGDEGIDGIINEDRLGLDTIYIQAKKWEGSVSRPEIQKFAGALQGKRSKKGVFITTSDFTKEARDYASIIDSKIILINGKELSELMIDYNVGVSVTKSFEIKRVDSDYFVEE